MIGILQMSLCDTSLFFMSNNYMGEIHPMVNVPMESVRLSTRLIKQMLLINSDNSFIYHMENIFSE